MRGSPRPHFARRYREKQTGTLLDNRLFAGDAPDAMNTTNKTRITWASALCLAASLNYGGTAHAQPVATSSNAASTAEARAETAPEASQAVATSPAIQISEKPAVVVEIKKTAPGLKVGANFFTRFEMRDGFDDIGRSRGRWTEGEFAVYRARLRLDTTPLDIGNNHKVTLRFAPQVDGYWGNQPGTVSNPNVGINEAYLRLMTDMLRLDVGHFMMDYGDAMIIGNLGWHQTARTFDGARVRIAPKAAKYWVDVFVTQLGEDIDGADASGFTGDTYFTGVYSDFGKMISKNTVLEPYLLAQLWRKKAGAEGATQATAGVRVKQTYGMFDVRAELGAQFGTRLANTGSVDVFAYQFDAEVGVKPMKGLRLSLEGLMASGDDATTADKNEGWDQLYPTAHKFLGLMDIIGGRSNLTSGVLHVAYKGVERFIFKLDAHMFLRPQTIDPQPSYAGSEVDINAIYVIGKGTKFRLMYAIFLPGSDAYASNDAAHYVEAQLGYNF